jgi:hypothetical protein
MNFLEYFYLIIFSFSIISTYSCTLINNVDNLHFNQIDGQINQDTGQDILADSDKDIPNNPPHAVVSGASNCAFDYYISVKDSTTTFFPCSKSFSVFFDGSKSYDDDPEDKIDQYDWSLKIEDAGYKDFYAAGFNAASQHKKTSEVIIQPKIRSFPDNVFTASLYDMEISVTLSVKDTHGLSGQIQTAKCNVKAGNLVEKEQCPEKWFACE